MMFLSIFNGCLNPMGGKFMPTLDCFMKLSEDLLITNNAINLGFIWFYIEFCQQGSFLEKQLKFNAFTSMWLTFFLQIIYQNSDMLDISAY